MIARVARAKPDARAVMSGFARAAVVDQTATPRDRAQPDLRLFRISPVPGILCHGGFCRKPSPLMRWLGRVTAEAGSVQRIGLSWRRARCMLARANRAHGSPP